MTVAAPAGGAGNLLRGWRARRGVSQLELALRTGISQRHLSFVEIGRSLPSREVLLRLATQLDMPLRERNALLLASGYAPVYPQTPLDAEALLSVRHALRKLLASHEPFPAMVVDQGWNLVWSNTPAWELLTTGVAPMLLSDPPNAMRVALHPEGLAPRIINLAEYAAHLFTRLRRQATTAPDDRISALYDEIRGYPATVSAAEPTDGGERDNMPFVPLRIRASDGQELIFFSTIATFGTATDITLAELMIESFFPGDKTTHAWLRTTFSG